MSSLNVLTLINLFEQMKKDDQEDFIIKINPTLFLLFHVAEFDYFNDMGGALDYAYKGTFTTYDKAVDSFLNQLFQELDYYNDSEHDEKLLEEIDNLSATKMTKQESKDWLNNYGWKIMEGDLE